MLRILFILAFCAIVSPVQAQPDLEIAKDTIITKSELFGSIYLLDGKKLTLPVMEWFMRDYPSSFDAIQGAVVADQLSVATYSVGSIFLLGGLLINRQDQRLSNDLYVLGGISIGGGILLQGISGRFQKKAVAVYNAEVKKDYEKSQKVRAQFGLQGMGVRLELRY